MLLNDEDFLAYCRKIADLEQGGVALDFETTGLSAYRGDRAFIIGVSHQTLGEVSCYLHYCSSEALRILCSNPRIKYAAHNIKFEMAFLREQYGVEIAGKLWDTEVFARTERNDHMRYGLQACAERIGETKHVPMLEWVKKNKKKLYSEAPPEIIIPYVEQDARLSRLLMERQIAAFTLWEQTTPVPISNVIRLEVETTRELFEMESRGMRLDVEYCRAALTYEEGRAQAAAQRFTDLTGTPFVDSRKTLAPVFDAHKIPYGKTEKGNASFTYDALRPSHEHPIVRALLDYREALKRASSYWQNFLDNEIDGRIHPNIKQTGAATFRMSVVDPACQTWPDDSEDPTCQYPIRRALTADDGGWLVSMDFAQMELRKIVDEAGELTMARDIETGTDFHQKVADVAKVKRGLAKNGRFAKLYGAGVPKIAQTLGISEELARKISDTIDEQSPRITEYSRYLIDQVKRMGYGYNWLGRRYFFKKEYDPETKRMRSFEYKMPNYRIQGGCGEILRIAIVKCGPLVRSVGGYICMPIHDELVFWIPHAGLHIIPKLKQAMIEAQRDKKILGMDVSVAVGKNLHDLEEWKAA